MARSRHGLAVALCIALSSTGLYGGILAGPIANPSNGHTYYLLTQNTWTQSEAEAVSLGGHLVTINDQAENDWVYSTFSNYGGSPKTLWLGLTDAANEGVWTWVSGEPVSFTNWTWWNPDNNGGAENYVHMYDGTRPSGCPSRWNDFGNGSSEYGIPLHGVVEVVPEPAATSLLALGVFGLVRRRHSA